MFFHWYTGSDELIEQAVPGAVPHQQTVFPPGEPQLEVPFGVLPPDPQASAREQGRKGDVFSLGHGVVGGDIPFVLHRFGVQTLVFLRLPGLLGFQGASAALDTCRRGGKDQIPTYRTDIEYGIFHISSLRGIFSEIRCEQALGADPQGRCQRRQQGDVRTAQPRLP